MKPYYDDGACVIYHGDGRHWIASQRALPVAVVITDPPYGSGLYESDRPVFDGGWLAMFLRDVGDAMVFGWPERLSRLAVEAHRAPDEWVTWWPSNARAGRGFAPDGLWREVECIAAWGKFAWTALRQPRLTTTTPMPNRGLRGSSTDPDARMGDVWRDESPNMNPRQAQRRLHPNEKPLDLTRRLVRVTDDQRTVIDPFMGSGTTLRAAKDLGRRAIGIEIEERYCEIAAQRLSQEVLDFGVPA